MEKVYGSDDQAKIDECIKTLGDVNAANKFGVTELMKAVRKPDNLMVVRSLLRAGADVNAANEDGITALMKCCYIHELMHAGADINAVDNENRTALYFAAKRNDYDAAKKLINHGASEKVGEDPYKIAERRRSYLVMLLLKERSK